MLQLLDLLIKALIFVRFIAFFFVRITFMAHADVIFFTVESEICTAAISHELTGFAEIEQRVARINTGMGSLFQQLQNYLSYIHSEVFSIDRRLSWVWTAQRQPRGPQPSHNRAIFRTYSSVIFKETVILTHFLRVYHLQTDMERCTFTFDK